MKTAGVIVARCRAVLQWVRAHQPTSDQKFYFCALGFGVCAVAFGTGVWSPGYFLTMMAVWVVAMYANSCDDRGGRRRGGRR